MQKKWMVAAVAAAVLVAAASLAVRWYGGGNGEGAADGGPFELVEAGHRELDGSPALALSFSQPLDRRGDYDKYIQVFEMPPRPEDAPGRPRVVDDEEDEESGGSGSPADAQVSRKPEDTAVEGGKRVDGAWVVGENPRLLFFPHIKPNTRYVLRAQPGLPSGTGATLAEEGRFSVRTAAVAAAFYFPSKGMVLPAAQNGGLPVTTVNVPEVDVQFLRVKADRLPAFLNQVIAGRPNPAAREAAEEEGEDEAAAYAYAHRNRLQGAVSLWDLDQLHKMTESVYLGRFLTEQKPNRRAVTFLPVESIKELKEPGIYVAVMSMPNRFRYEYQTTYFYVSDLGLHLRQYANGADAYISSLTDGKGVSGVEVSWLDDNGRILRQASSNSDGRASFPERPKNAKVILAKKGEQVSMVALKEPALDLSEYDISGNPQGPVRLFAYSGRNLYRPGESFDVSVLARDADGREVPPQPVSATLRRPDGKAQFTALWQPDSRFSGYFRRTLELPADAPTGFWTLELRADPAARSAATTFRFGVEEFLPERMKLDISGAKPQLGPRDELALEVRGAYLYGAPAAGNRLLGVVNVERARNPLAQKLPGFEFGDVNEDSARERSELDEVSLDEAGKARVAVDLSAVRKRHSPFTLRATLSLLESGGRPVVRSYETVHWPTPVLVGVRPLFTGAYARENAPVQFEVVRADAAGKLQAGRALPARLFRENRAWYWRFDDQRGWNSGFTESDELVSTAVVDVPAGGRGKLTLPVQYGRYRLEVLDPESGQTLRYRFYAGWSAKDDESQGVRPDRVALKFDKAAYRDGDTATLNISPPHGGEALVTVEGDSALWVKRISLPAEGGSVDIPVRPEWRRHDLYVSVLVLRPGNSGDKVTPARALGLVHLPLERSERRLTVNLEAPQKMEPDRPLKVKVKVPEAKGQKAVVTLSAVDAGILNITRFPSPDPFGFYFGRLRYGADMYDIYGRLIEKMAGQKGKLKFGGDAAPKPTRSLPKKVRLVDLFSGPVALDANGEAEITLPVPDFNGSLRLMAVAATPERFGAQESEITVAAPLVAEVATPRFLSVGDSAVLALDLQNLSGAEMAVKVRLSNPDGLLIRDGERRLSLKHQQKQTLRIPVEAGTAFGLTELKLRVEGPPQALERTFPLQVQAPTPRQTVVRRFSVAPGESLEVKEGELAGFLRQTAAASLALSNRAPIDVRSAVQGLLTYPYGCAEQTTSTAYPHLFIDEEGAKLFGLKPYSREKRVEMLDKAVARLAGMQAPSGGFSLWGNLSEYEYWLSAYVANFLVDAREQGFGVPEEMHRKAMDFLLRGLQEGVAGLPAAKAAYSENSVWSDRRFAGSGRFGVLAYGAYVLAREGKAPLATLRQLHESQALAHSGLSLVQLGLALKLMGDEGRAASSIAAGLGKPRENNYWWGDYGSTLRDTALAYYLLEKHKVKAAGQEALIVTLAGEMERGSERYRYYSTQEKLALFLVGRSFVGGSNGPWTAELQSGGGKPAALAGKGTLLQELEVATVAGGFKVHNPGKERLYGELSLSGNPARAPAPRKGVIELKRDYFAADGSALPARPLKVGETVLVRLQVRTRGRVANGLVVDGIPAGLEIENLNLVQGEQMNAIQVGGVDPREAMQNPAIQHVEFRDDRFVVAARLSGTQHFFYRARVVTPGRFIVPPTYAEDMYQPQVYGSAGGGETLVVGDGLPAAKAEAAPAAAPAAPAAAPATEAKP